MNSKLPYHENRKKKRTAGLVDTRRPDSCTAGSRTFGHGPAEYYAHDLPFAVMELMGFNEEQQHRLFLHYRLWQEEARHIDISKGNAHMRNLAERIYEMLEKLKNSTASANRPQAPTLQMLPDSPVKKGEGIYYYNFVRIRSGVQGK